MTRAMVELSMEDVDMLCAALELEANSANQMLDRSWATKCYRLRSRLGKAVGHPDSGEQQEEAVEEESLYAEFLKENHEYPDPLGLRELAK